MRELFDTLAALLRYPDDTTASLRSRLGNVLQSQERGTEPRPSGSGLEEFARAAAALSVEELQELYVRTFEMTPDACLDIGWHLFGENYERGEFLVRMRQTLRRCGVAESSELPDHLSHVLAALGRMENDEAVRFVEECLQPALAKIISALDGHPYQALLRGVESALTPLRQAGVGA